MISCCHCRLSTYALTRAYSQMLCCEHTVTALMLLQNLVFVLLLSVFGVVAIAISVYATDESTCLRIRECEVRVISTLISLSSDLSSTAT
jgi:hypothetical protein